MRFHRCNITNDDHVIWIKFNFYRYESSNNTVGNQ